MGRNLPTRRSDRQREGEAGEPRRLIGHKERSVDLPFEVAGQALQLAKGIVIRRLARVVFACHDPYKSPSLDDLVITPRRPLALLTSTQPTKALL
jgi:hypothetical protein